MFSLYKNCISSSLRWLPKLSACTSKQARYIEFTSPYIHPIIAFKVIFGSFSLWRRQWMCSGNFNDSLHLKGVFAKNERGYRLNAIKKRFWSPLILFLSVASVRRKLLKTTYTEERTVHTKWESCNTWLGS